MDREPITSNETEYLTLTQVAKLVPGGDGKRVSLKTLHRWCGRGLKGGIRLRSVRIGGRRYTTRRWFEDFIESLSRECPAQVQAVWPRSPDRRRAASERAASELKQAWSRKTP